MARVGLRGQTQLCIAAAVCAVVLVAVSMWLLTVSHIQTRWDPYARGRRTTAHDSLWLEALTKSFNHSTVYSLNLWYQYARYIAKSHNRSSCYVCSFLPVAASAPHVTPLPVPKHDRYFPSTLRSLENPKLLSRIVNTWTGMDVPVYRKQQMSNVVKGLKFTMIHQSCCTYIPDNDEDGGVIQQVFANLTKLRDVLLKDNVVQWFPGGPQRHFRGAPKACLQNKCIQKH